MDRFAEISPANGDGSTPGELPSVALTQRFLSLCNEQGSQRLLAVGLVAVGRSTGVPGLPVSDDWTAWDAGEMRVAVKDVSAGDMATLPETLRRCSRTRPSTTSLRNAAAATGVVMLVLLAVSGWQVQLEAKSWRVNQLPNAGNVLDADGVAVGCNVCHTDGGGTTRNPFGQAVEGILTDPTDSTETFWSATLATLDSDGDGATNGAELLDASGTWTVGDADPGSASAVTHPGDPTSVQESVATDRAALVALYNATGGSNWRVSNNWLTNAQLSDWFGVNTDTATGRVTELGLGNVGLTGSIPAIIGNLDQLQDLHLGQSQMTGPIPPEVGKLTNLTQLHIGAAGVGGPIPSELQNLTNLEELILFGNSLTGPIPTWLGDLTNLVEVNLAENELTGGIPSELESLTNLLQLALYDNALTGTIPSWLGNLTGLLGLYLSGNDFSSGPVPSEFENLTSLRWLHLAETNRTGQIPAGLGDLTEILELDLGGNRLTRGCPVRC